MKVYFYSVLPSGADLVKTLYSLYVGEWADREALVSGKLMRVEEVPEKRDRGCRSFEIVRARQPGLFALGQSGQRARDLPLGEDEHLFASAVAAIKGDTLAVQRNMSVRESMILRYFNEIARKRGLPLINLVPEIRHDKLQMLRKGRCKSLTFEVACSDAMSTAAFAQNRIGNVLLDRRRLRFGRISVTLRADRNSRIYGNEASALVQELLSFDEVTKLAAKLDGAMPSLDMLKAHQHIEIEERVDLTQPSRCVIDKRMKTVVDALCDYAR